MGLQYGCSGEPGPEPGEPIGNPFADKPTPVWTFDLEDDPVVVGGVVLALDGLLLDVPV